MTAGFVCFGVGVPLFAIALRQLVPGPAWIAAIVSGLATLGVAAFPLHVSTAVDRVHGTFASVGYVALALVPFFAARALSLRGQRLAATASRGVAAVAAVCLALTPVASANGLFQRAGLTVVDLWLVVAAVGLRCSRTPDRGAQNLSASLARYVYAERTCAPRSGVMGVPSFFGVVLMPAR